MLARLPNDTSNQRPSDGHRNDARSTEPTGAADSLLGLSVETDTSFWADAACNDGEATLAGVFFSDELQDIARAKRICAACPVMEQCLEGALGRKEPWGVWGGQLFSNGRILVAKRRRGRPPKHARAEDEFVHIPVPEALQDAVALRTA